MQERPAMRCVRGHVQDAATRIVRPNGTGYCRTCQYTLDRARRQRSKQAQIWPTTPEDLRSLMQQVHRQGLCWLWVGPTALGQPIFYRRGAHYSAARFAYEAVQQPLAVADRLERSCESPLCICPYRGHVSVRRASDAGLSHALRVVDPSGRNTGKSHCKRGHAFTPENTGINGGSRYCRMCKSLLNRAKKPQHQSHLTPAARTLAYVETLREKPCMCPACEHRSPDNIKGPPHAARAAQADLERFTSGFVVDAATSCWLWLRARNNDGYGNFSVKSRPLLAHRYAFEMFRAPLTSSVPLRHICAHAHCVNPDHVEPSRWGPRFRLDVPKNTLKQSRRVASASGPSAASAAAAPHLLD